MTNVSVSRSPSPQRLAEGSLAAQFRAARLDWIIPDWPAPGAVHGFVTTRNGAVAPDAFIPGPPYALTQVHGAHVVRISARCPPAPSLKRDGVASGPRTGHSTRGDALVTRDEATVLAIRVADCLPVLFTDVDAKVIGIAHAGWRGLAAGVLENTVHAMDCDASRIVAWLGPAIGPTAFEVGGDVRSAFVDTDAGASGAFVGCAPGKWLADLSRLARRRLSRAGVGRVHGGDLCTVTDAARFHSFRRDGDAGRMTAFIWRDRLPA